MKLRFHNNSLRFRLNQLEVTQLVSGVRLSEQLWFPYTARPFDYSMSIHGAPAKVEFGPEAPEIAIFLHRGELTSWAASESLELHLTFETAEEPLKVMVEKDLVRRDLPMEEQDHHAYPRSEETARY
jgi:hypothetical protein